MTNDGRVSMRETVETAMPNAARVSFSIPLYTTPQEPSPRTPYGWQVQGLRDTYKGDHAEQDAKAEAARVGGTAYAFPIYIDPPVSEEPCYCDKNKLGDPSKSCGDCPRKDYKS